MIFWTSIFSLIVFSTAFRLRTRWSPPASRTSPYRNRRPSGLRRVRTSSANWTTASPSTKNIRLSFTKRRSDWRPTPRNGSSSFRKCTFSESSIRSADGWVKSSICSTRWRHTRTCPSRKSKVSEWGNHRGCSYDRNSCPDTSISYWLWNSVSSEVQVIPLFSRFHQKMKKLKVP